MSFVVLHEVFVPTEKNFGQMPVRLCTLSINKPLSLTAEVKIKGHVFRFQLCPLHIFLDQTLDSLI